VPLGGRGFVTVGAAVACCALAAACTSDPVPTSTPSTSPTATTPTESQIERQMRLDYDAAKRLIEPTLRNRTGLPGRVAFADQRLHSDPLLRVSICPQP
jgi:hypothetical protein